MKISALWSRSPSLCTVSALVLLLAGCSVGSVGGSSPPTTLSPAVSVSPSSAFVAPGGPQQFTAKVSNTSNTAVTWQVNGAEGGNAATGTITSGGLYTAPGTAGSVTVTAVLQGDSSKTASANVTVLAPHPVGVRPAASGFAEFYTVATGNTFTPRGNNYARLAWQQPPGAGQGKEYSHSTFNVGRYDSTRTETALAAMQSNDYNIVRVFLNGCCNDTIGNPNGAGLSSAYIANVADFLKRAANHRVYVIFTWEGLPAQGGYDTGPCTDFDDPDSPITPPTNLVDLCPGGVAAEAHFFHDLVQALVDQGARLDAIFSYELRNEYYYESQSIPLSRTSGMVTPADGRTYDMSSATSRQQMMDNGLIYYTNQVRAAIMALDPTALVDVGFFWPQKPNPTRVGDPRVIEVYPMMANSTADFVDVHGGPGASGLSLDQLAQNYGFVGHQQQKPVLMGEFAATEGDYPAISDAATALRNWQIQSCTYSLKGWLLWAWGTEEAEQRPLHSPPYWWSAVSGHGAINKALAPAVRPNPCQ
jgi:hypothetical protein